MRKSIQALLIVVILWTIAATINPENKSASTERQMEELPRVGFKAPGFALVGLDGKTYSLEQLNGKPVVINFWASWCPPCKAEAPELVKLYDQYNDRLEIYAVNLTMNDNEEKARAFAQEYGFVFPVLLDPKGEVSETYQIAGIPTTIFVNQDGIIKDILPGYGGPEMLKNKFAEWAAMR